MRFVIQTVTPAAEAKRAVILQAWYERGYRDQRSNRFPADLGNLSRAAQRAYQAGQDDAAQRRPKQARFG